LPHWWPRLFWLTIVLLLAYGLHYQFIGNRSQPKALTAEAALAAFVVTDEAVLAGEEIYAESCSVCHGVALEGGIGPSFLDDMWRHGDDPETVIRIITDGVPENGMLAWDSILTGQQVNQVAAFVLRTNQEAVGQ